MNNLEILNNSKKIEGINVLEVEFDENGEPFVWGRKLHSALKVETRYNDWFSRMCDYGFSESIDFYSILSKTSDGGRPSVDHKLKIDMAKEVAMLQRNEAGKVVRKYLIQVEKDFNTPEKVMARALRYASMQLDAVKLENIEQRKLLEEQKPKVIFADSVKASKTSILVGELAKIIKQNGHDIGQNRLFTWLRKNNYLVSRKGTDYNMPTQKAMNLGLFEVKETSVTHSDGHISISKTAKVTGKGQVYFVNKFIKERVLGGQKCLN